METIWLYLHVLKIKIYSLFLRTRLAELGLGSVIHPPATLYRPDLIRIGKRTVIREHAWLNAARCKNRRVVLSIGDGCYIGRFSQINSMQNVTIEDKVLIADKVYISDFDHNFSDPQLPVIDQGVTRKGDVTIRSGTWIGTGAVILSGVTIGRNAIIGANSVVNKNIPDYAIAAGTPAKVIRLRETSDAEK